MKKFRKLLALLLCLAMLASLLGCQNQTDTTEPTTETTEAPTETTAPPPPEPTAEELYAEARAALDALSDVTLSITEETTRVVAGQDFVEKSEITLTYAGIGTDALQVSQEENYKQIADEEDKPKEDIEDKDAIFCEVYSDGVLYFSLDTDRLYQFSSEITPEECAARYLPVVLLDAALYGSMTSESDGTNTTITFSEPTAAETWAMPEEAELVDASGTAVVDASGALTQMTYTITYQYGSTEYTTTVTSAPQAETDNITLPKDPDAFVNIHPDVYKAYLTSVAMLIQSDSTSSHRSESVFCQAGGFQQNQGVSVNRHGEEKGMDAKIETNIYFYDYTGWQVQTETYELVEEYIDSKYVMTVDDGVPTSQLGVDYALIENYCLDLMVSNIPDPAYWQEAVITDLGSLYLVEFTYNEDFGNTVQNEICTDFFQDPSLLNGLASAYVTNETTGYMAFDKYTGFPTAAGYYYEGTHTIDGGDYTLSKQSDLSIDGLSLGSYKEITDEMLPEDAPEVAPTPLFYHVTGPDGQEMWLFGTIHVGDNRTAHLPQEIFDALAASDALAVECDTEGFDEQCEEDEALQAQVSDMYYYSDGTTIEDHLEPELYEIALKYLKATGNYNMNSNYLKVFFWYNAIDNYYLQQGYQLTGDQGVEERLTKFAEENEIPLREVESSLFQIGMMSGFSEELTVWMLEGVPEYHGRDSWEGSMELFELWCAGDEAALRELISCEVDTSEMTEEEIADYEEHIHLLEEYNNSMSHDRNEGMLKVAIDYLESGEVIFYAVGLAHLLDETNGLVDALRAAGYTVELVTFAS